MPAPSPIDKSVAILVERAAGMRGIVVARGKRAHGSESADAHRRDRSFRSAGNHDIRIAALDDPIGVADGVSAGGAGRRGGLVRALGAVADADLTRGQVDDGRGNKKGRNFARAARQHGAVFALDNVESADARADVNADALGILRRDLQARRFHGLMRGGESEMDEAPHLARFFFLDEWQRIEVLHFCGKSDGKAGRVKAVIGAIPLSPANRLLQTCCGIAHSANESNAGDNDTTLQDYLPPLPFFLM